MSSRVRVLMVGLGLASAVVSCGSSGNGAATSDGGSESASASADSDGSTGTSVMPSEATSDSAAPSNDATASDTVASSSDASASGSSSSSNSAASSNSSASSGSAPESGIDAGADAVAAPGIDATTDAPVHDASDPPDVSQSTTPDSAPAPAGGAALLATGDTRSVTEPTYPAVCSTLSAQFTISDRSSPPSSDDTDRIQAALTACEGTGQSVVLAMSGTNDAFYSGTLTVNGEALVVDAGVTLFGNNSYTGELLAIRGVNSALMGPGSVDGRGDLISGIPRLIQASNITNFTVYNVTIEHSGKEHLYVQGGNGFTAWNLTVATPANTKNTDGIDIDSLTNATVYGSSISDGDDGIAIKTNAAATSNITVENNTFHGTHGMSIGSQTFDGVVNVLWKGNTVYGTDPWGNTSTNNNGINIKTDVDCGGTVRQVTYLDTCMTGVKHLLVFNTSYGSCTGTMGTPYFTDIVVDGVYGTDSASGAYSEFEGYSAAFPLGLTLENVNLDVTTQQNSQYANVALYQSNLIPSGTGVVTQQRTGSGSVPTCSF
jgi:polygalacturonase